MKRIEITDSTGRLWLSDPDVDGELTPTAIETVVSSMKNFAEIESLAIAVNGVDHYFNPAQVIAWAIADVDESA